MAEEHVLSWRTAGFHELGDLLAKVEKARKERGRKRNEAYAAVFTYLLECLRKKCDELPPLLQMVFLTLDTVTACLEMLTTTGKTEKLLEEVSHPEVEGISDAELPEDASSQEEKTKEPPPSDEATTTEVEPSSVQQLDQMDLEELRRKREELEAAMATQSDDDNEGESSSSLEAVEKSDQEVLTTENEGNNESGMEPEAESL